MSRKNRRPAEARIPTSETTDRRDVIVHAPIAAHGMMQMIPCPGCGRAVHMRVTRRPDAHIVRGLCPMCGQRMEVQLLRVRPLPNS